MSTFPWLTVAGAIPLAGAVVIALVPGRPATPGPASTEPAGTEPPGTDLAGTELATTGASGAEATGRARDLLVKRIALVFSVITLAVTIAMAVQFKTGGPDFQFTEQVQWIPQFGVHYAVGVDGIALVLILMSVILMPVVVLASWNDVEDVPAGAGAGAGAATPAPGGGENGTSPASGARPARSPRV